jgi:hypothetical protein
MDTVRTFALQLGDGDIARAGASLYTRGLWWSLKHIGAATVIIAKSNGVEVEIDPRHVWAGSQIIEWPSDPRD